jgi:hypothetical protein
VLARDGHRGQREHQVRQHRPGGAPGHLRRKVGRGVPPGHPAEEGIDERHHRVEVAAGNRAEHQNDREQPGRRRRRVFQQLQPGLARRQPLRGDPGSDHHRGQERTAEKLVCDLAHEELAEAAAVHWSIADPVPAGDPGSFDAALAQLADRVERLAPRLAAVS